MDRFLDVALYAPVGLLVSRQQPVTDLAAAGRKQLAFSRSLGRAALKGIAKGMFERSPGRGTSDTTEEPDTPVEAPTAGVIEGYDDMSARELIALAKTCTDAEAAWLGEQERAGKNRVTVLRALDARSRAA